MTLSYIERHITGLCLFLISCVTWFFAGTCGSQNVSADHSIFYGEAINGTPTWVAGTRLNFYVQLRDASSINVSTSLLTNLTVRCVADPSAPPNASFCLDGPWISPVGLGCYHVVLRVGTIWSAFRSVADSGEPVSEISLQGQNYLHVLYGGRHLLGSPFRPSLQPEASLSRYHSYMLQPLQYTVATTARITIMKFVQIFDQYLNYIRNPSILSNLTFTLTSDVAFADPKPVLAWKYDSSCIMLSLENATMVATHKFSIYYMNPMGFQERLYLYSNGRLVDEGTFHVRPKTIASVDVTPTGNEVEANETISFNIVMRDAFGNVAVLTRSYNLGRTPFYTPGDQDLSLLQVRSEPVGCGPQECPNATITMSLLNQSVGLVEANVTCSKAGKYETTIYLEGRIVYTGEHLVEAQSRASINKSYVKMDNARVTAGETPRLLINLVDEFGNSINNTQYVHHGVSLLYLLPNNTSIRQQIHGDLNQINMISTASGNYSLALLLGDHSTEWWNYTVNPNPKSSPYYSVARGLGLGVVDSSSKTSNAMTPYIYAGVVYDVQIDGYDAWNNKQAGMMTRFRLNEGFEAACDSISYLPNILEGATTIRYDIKKSGLYEMSILTKELEHVLVQPLLVVPYPVINNEEVTVLSNRRLDAGSRLSLTTSFWDRYGNMIIPPFCYLVLSGGILARTYMVYPESSEAGPSLFVTSINDTGLYDFYVQAPEYNYTTRTSQVQVTPAPTRPSNSFLSGRHNTPLNLTTSLHLHLRDEYGNHRRPDAKDVQQVAVALQPEGPYLVALQAQEDFIALHLTFFEAGAYDVYVTMNGEPTTYFPWQMLALPASHNASVCLQESQQQITENQTQWNCGVHGSLYNGFCICDDGWWTNTTLWVNGSKSWCNVPHTTPRAQAQHALPLVIVVSLLVTILALLMLAIYLCRLRTCGRPLARQQGCTQ